MTEFKVGDIAIAGKDIGNNGLVKGKEYRVIRIKHVSCEGTLLHLDGGFSGFAWRFALKNKIQVGSTYATPTGLKRKVVFSDENGALADDLDPVNNKSGGNWNRKWYSHRQTGGWTLVPPEQWVNITRAPTKLQLSSKIFTSEQEAKDDPISGTKAEYYIRSVRVDEAWNPTSSG